MLKKTLVTFMLSTLIVFSFSQSAFAKRQPRMERSLEILQNAERVLNKARPNKGGHRYKALQHIRRAMNEVRRGMEYANRRPAGGQLKKKKQIERETQKQRRKHKYDEREYTEEDERRKEEEYLRNRY